MFKTRCFANMGSGGREYTVLEVSPYEGSVVLAVRIPGGGAYSGKQRDILLDREQARELGDMLLDFAAGDPAKTSEPKSWDLGS